MICVSNEVFITLELKSVILTNIVAVKVSPDHGEDNSMKIKTLFPVLLILKLNKEEE